MHAESTKRQWRVLTTIVLILALAGCGKGDGPQAIAGTPATPLPDVPAGFCDPINFEVVCPPPTIVNFNGGATTVIDNPDMSGINDSEKVAQMQKFPDEVFGGTKFELIEALDFSAGEAFTVKVWSPRTVEVLFKLEENGNPAGGLAKVNNSSGGSAWEELCFDFTGQSGSVPPPVTAVTVIFDNGVLGAADVNPADWTFYYDDITQVESCGDEGGGTTMLPVDFENAPASYDFGLDGGFEGGVASVIANPDQSGINVSAQVGQMQKFAATSGATFGGSTLQLDTPADVVANSSFSMKVWSQRQVVVLLQPEPQGPGAGTEVIHSGTGWEELTFLLPALTGTVNAITLIFDNGTLGDAEANPNDWTFYFDDITLLPPDTGGGGGGGGDVADPGTTPEFVLFGTTAAADLAFPVGGPQNFGSGASFDLAYDQDNSFVPVIAVTAGNGYAPDAWVAFIAVPDYAAPIAVGFDTFNAKVKGSPDGRIEVKLIGGGDDSVIEVNVASYAGSTDLGDGWYELSIPFSEFSNVANIPLHTGWLIGPPGDQGDAAFVFLLTDVGFSNAGGGGDDGKFTNGDFETADLTGWTPGENGTITVENATLDGRTGNFARLQTTAAPQDVLLSQVALGAGTIVAGDMIDVSFDLIGTLTGDSGVVFVEVIFLDGSGQDVGGRNFVGPAAPYFPTATWATNSGTVTAGTGANGTQYDVSGGVTLQLKAACGGVPGCAVDAYFDNVTFTVNGE